MDTPWITVKELAVQLAVSPSMIYQLAGDGSIPARKVGQRWKFDLAEVKAALDAKKSDPWRQSNKSLGRKRGPRRSNS